MDYRKLLAAILPPAFSLALVLGLWELGVRALGVKAYLLPPPSAIFEALVDPKNGLAWASVITARAAIFGFVLSGVIGVIAAIVISSSRLMERALYPYTVFLQTVPIVAIAPLLVIWFGPGDRAVTVAAFIVSVFPVIANTVSGMRSVEPALRDLFRLYGASSAQTLFGLSLPASLPSLVTGLRVASGLAVIGTVVGEFAAGFAEDNAGLGITILAMYRQLRTDVLFAAVLCACALGLCLFGATNLLGWLLLRRWHPSEKS